MATITQIPSLPLRKTDAHKGDFGKVCIIAGSTGFTGAAVLAGNAALRSGSGLVKIACPKSSQPIIAAMDTCCMTLPLDEDSHGQLAFSAYNTLSNTFDQHDCFAYGPGLGTNNGVRDIVSTLITQKGLKIIIDADGLNCLAKLGNWSHKNEAQLILTPHPGEMKRLWKGLFREPIPESHVEIATTFAKQTKSIIAFKGHDSIVTDGTDIYINKTGNPGMATAGSGDVLTGIITSLVGQSFNLLEAAILGVYIHGLAGDIAAEEIGQIGMTATDILNAVPRAFVKHTQS